MRTENLKPHNTMESSLSKTKQLISYIINKGYRTPDYRINWKAHKDLEGTIHLSYKKAPWPLTIIIPSSDQETTLNTEMSQLYMEFGWKHKIWPLKQSLKDFFQQIEPFLPKHRDL